MKKRTYAFLFVMVASTACTTATSNLTNASSPKDLPGYSQSYDVVFGAAVDAISLLSWEITVAQKDAGIIQGETSPRMAPQKEERSFPYKRRS